MGGLLRGEGGEQRGRFRVLAQGGIEALDEGLGVALQQVANQAEQAVGGFAIGIDMNGQVGGFVGGLLQAIAPDLPPTGAIGLVRLAGVKRGIGVAQQHLGLRLVGRVKRHAQAHAHLGQHAVAEVERRFDGAVNAVEHDGQIAGLRHAFEHQHELVAAQPRDQIGLAHGGPEALAQLTQKLVARGVAVGVVDRLEIIEIHHAHDQQIFVAAGPGHGQRQVVFEGKAVGQAGQGVVAGQVALLRLLGFQIGLEVDFAQRLLDQLAHPAQQAVQAFVQIVDVEQHQHQRRPAPAVAAQRQGQGKRLPARQGVLGPGLQQGRVRVGLLRFFRGVPGAGQGVGLGGADQERRRLGGQRVQRISPGSERVHALVHIGLGDPYGGEQAGFEQAGAGALQHFGVVARADQNVDLRHHSAHQFLLALATFALFAFGLGQLQTIESAAQAAREFFEQIALVSGDARAAVAVNAEHRVEPVLPQHRQGGHGAQTELLHAPRPGQQQLGGVFALHIKGRSVAPNLAKRPLAADLIGMDGQRHSVEIGGLSSGSEHLGLPADIGLTDPSQLHASGVGADVANALEQRGLIRGFGYDLAGLRQCGIDLRQPVLALQTAVDQQAAEQLHQQQHRPACQHRPGLTPPQRGERAGRQAGEGNDRMRAQALPSAQELSAARRLHRPEENPMRLLGMRGNFACEHPARGCILERGLDLRQRRRQPREQIAVTAQQAHRRHPAALAVETRQSVLQILQRSLQAHVENQHDLGTRRAFVQGQRAAGRGDVLLWRQRIGLQQPDANPPRRGQGLLKTRRRGDGRTRLRRDCATRCKRQHIAGRRDQGNAVDEGHQRVHFAQPRLRLLQQIGVVVKLPLRHGASGLKLVVTLVYRVGPERGLALQNLLDAVAVAIPAHPEHHANGRSQQ